WENHAERRKLNVGVWKYHIGIRKCGFPVWGDQPDGHLNCIGVCRRHFPIRENGLVARHIVEVVRRHDVDVWKNKGEPNIIDDKVYGSALMKQYEPYTANSS